MRLTSPLDEAALADLHAQAAYHRVTEEDGRVVAFLLALAPGRSYGSPNYIWFAARHDDFLYVDRVVVVGDRRRAGLGGALYDDVAAWAAAHGFGRLVCEVNIEPPNEVSAAFHRRHGFARVGTQWVAGGTKRVALLEKLIAPASRPRVARLEDLPYVGPAIAAKLRLVDVREPSDLVGRDPYHLYDELAERVGRRPDPCLLDVFITVTRFMGGAPARPWWEYTAERKARMAGDRQAGDGLTGDGPTGDR